MVQEPSTPSALVASGRICVLVKPRCADAVLSTNLRSRHSSFLFLNHAYDLFVAKL